MHKNRLLAWVSFVLFAAVCQVAAFCVSVKYGADGRWMISLLVGLVPVLLSHGGAAFVRAVFEPKADIAPMFSRKTQSWAFLYGDRYALPVAFTAAALGQSRVSADSWFNQNEWWWTIGCYAIGWAIGFAWMLGLDGPNYRKAGEGDRLTSPTKLWHDLVVYSSLSGALVKLGVPTIAHFSWWTALAIASVVAWAVLGLHFDGKRAKRGELIPVNLHPPVQDTVLG